MTSADIAVDLPGTEGRIRKLRRAEYDRLVQAGAFDHDKIELIRGVLVQRTPQGTPHASTIQRLTVLFVRTFGDRTSVRVQSPVIAPDESEPEPDFAVVPLGEYIDEHRAIRSRS